MTTVTAEQILDLARRLAQARGTTIKALVQSLITQLDRSKTAYDSLLGLFADEPALLDQVLDQAMQSRETRPLVRGIVNWHLHV